MLRLPSALGIWTYGRLQEAGSVLAICLPQDYTLLRSDKKWSRVGQLLEFLISVWNMRYSEGSFLFLIVKRTCGCTSRCGIWEAVDFDEIFGCLKKAVRKSEPQYSIS